MINTFDPLSVATIAILIGFNDSTFVIGYWHLLNTSTSKADNDSVETQANALDVVFGVHDGSLRIQILSQVINFQSIQ